jgi:hypothetical protein
MVPGRECKWLDPHSLKAVHEILDAVCALSHVTGTFLFEPRDVLGNRIHVAGGSVQSAIVPLPKGLSFDTDSREAFEELAGSSWCYAWRRYRLTPQLIHRAA